jgi:hypothetical protein
MRPTNLCAKCIFMKWPCAIATLNMYFCVQDSSLREFFIIFYPFPDIRFSESKFSSMTAQGGTNRTAMQYRFRESFDIYSPLQAFTINRSQLGFCTSYNFKPSELTRSSRAQKHLVFSTQCTFLKNRRGDHTMSYYGSSSSGKLSVLFLHYPNSLIYHLCPYIILHGWSIIQVDEAVGESTMGGHMSWGQREGT